MVTEVRHAHGVGDVFGPGLECCASREKDGLEIPEIETWLPYYRVLLLLV